MIVTCPACSQQYKLRESKIQGRGAKVTCPRCGHRFVIYRTESDRAASKQIPSAPTEVGLDAPKGHAPQEGRSLFERDSSGLGSRTWATPPSGASADPDQATSERLGGAQASPRAPSSAPGGPGGSGSGGPEVLMGSTSAPDSQRFGRTPRNVEALDFSTIGITWRVRKGLGALGYSLHDLATLRDHLADGRISRWDQLSFDGREWVEVGSIPNLEAFFWSVWQRARRGEVVSKALPTSIFEGDDEEDEEDPADAPTTIVGRGSTLAGEIRQAVAEAVSGGELSAPLDRGGLGRSLLGSDTFDELSHGHPPSGPLGNEPAGDNLDDGEASTTPAPGWLSSETGPRALPEPSPPEVSFSGATVRPADESPEQTAPSLWRLSPTRPELEQTESYPDAAEPFDFDMFGDELEDDLTAETEASSDDLEEALRGDLFSPDKLSLDPPNQPAPTLIQDDGPGWGDAAGEPQRAAWPDGLVSLAAPPEPLDEDPGRPKEEEEDPDEESVHDRETVHLEHPLGAQGLEPRSPQPPERRQPRRTLLTRSTLHQPEEPEVEVSGSSTLIPAARPRTLQPEDEPWGYTPEPSSARGERQATPPTVSRAEPPELAALGPEPTAEPAPPVPRSPSLSAGPPGGAPPSSLIPPRRPPQRLWSPPRRAPSLRRHGTQSAGSPHHSRLPQASPTPAARRCRSPPRWRVSCPAPSPGIVARWLRSALITTSPSPLPCSGSPSPSPPSHFPGCSWGLLRSGA
ncbi:MAG TPA: hypothetical protein ENK18_14195 [Deltaproteobacteria bacterium]|nr:hypothetical protein [Deltaproteobacteria bacterium]